MLSFILVFSGCNKLTPNKDNTEAQPTHKPVTKGVSEVMSNSVHKTVNFSTFEVNKKYFNDVNGFVELKLKLPRLDWEL